MIDFPSTGDPEADGEGTASLVDGTLGGYWKHHNRPPGFAGSDGHPYTVSVEVEKTPNLLAPYSGFLVFPRWADTGLGIIGHVETPMLLQGKSRDEVESALRALTLLRAGSLLEEAIRSQHEETE
jgi:hypothetical protein